MAFEAQGKGGQFCRFPQTLYSQSVGCDIGWRDSERFVRQSYVIRLPPDKMGIPGNRIIQGDALSVLKTLPDESVDCIVTSPPYWALRDYGVKGQLGLERTVEEYIDNLCRVFVEARRVLKNQGSCWVNLGDTFSTVAGMKNTNFNERWHGKKYNSLKQLETDRQRPRRPSMPVPKKCLVGVPFRFALAMIERDWTLRNVIIWHKPNCMPSSAIDRFTIDFEYLFFFVKSSRYFFEPQFEPHHESTKKRVEQFVRNRERFDPKKHKQGNRHLQTPFEVLERISRTGLHPLGRRKRCVWSIPTQGFLGKHFATFPERLVETPIRAGCPEFVCTKCDQARKRVFRPSAAYAELLVSNRINGANRQSWFPGRDRRLTEGKKSGNEQRVTAEYASMGWRACRCRAEFVPGIVLDPFFGAGTTGLVALRLGRRFIGIELNPEYIQMAKDRLRPDLPT